MDHLTSTHTLTRILSAHTHIHTHKHTHTYIRAHTLSISSPGRVPPPRGKRGATISVVFWFWLGSARGSSGSGVLKTAEVSPARFAAAAAAAAAEQQQLPACAFASSSSSAAATTAASSPSRASSCSPHSRSFLVIPLLPRAAPSRRRRRRLRSYRHPHRHRHQRLRRPRVVP